MPFFRTSWCVSIINSAMFLNSFHNRVEFGTIFLSAFGISGGGGLNTPNPPLGTPLDGLPSQAKIKLLHFDTNCTFSITTITIQDQHSPYNYSGHIFVYYAYTWVHKGRLRSKLSSVHVPAPCSHYNAIGSLLPAIWSYIITVWEILTLWILSTIEVSWNVSPCTPDAPRP